MRTAPLLLLAGCFGVLPFRNEPPKLVSVNGVELERAQGSIELGEALPGDTLPLTIEVKDPERDKVRIWFPYAQGTVQFDPDAREGSWTIPEWAAGQMELQIVLEDDRSPPARQSWYLELFLPGGCYYYAYGSGCTSTSTGDTGL